MKTPKRFLPFVALMATLVALVSLAVRAAIDLLQADPQSEFTAGSIARRLVVGFVVASALWLDRERRTRTCGHRS